MPNSPLPDRLLIADSGPLIGLEGIGHLHLLPQLYRRVGAPPAVVAEILAAQDPRIGQHLLSQALWLERLPAPTSLPGAGLSLGHGEAQAITLASQDPTAVLLLDDRAARRAAEALGLPITGSAGILVRARREGLVRAVRPLLLAMRGNGYYVSDRVVVAACRAVGEPEV